MSSIAPSSRLNFPSFSPSRTRSSSTSLSRTRARRSPPDPHSNPSDCREALKGHTFVIAKRTLADVGDCHADGVKGGRVERLAQRRVWRRPDLEDARLAVLRRHLVFDGDQLFALEDELEERGREAREQLYVGRACLRRQPDGVRAQVPEDNAWRGVGLPAHFAPHLVEPALQPLEMRLPSAAAEPAGRIKLHVREDDQVWDLVRRELGLDRSVEDAIARPGKVGVATPRRVARRAHLCDDAAVRREVDPARLGLEREHAMREPGLAQLGDEDAERDRHLHRRAGHAPRDVHERDKLAQVDAVGRARHAVVGSVAHAVRDAFGGHLGELLAHGGAEGLPLRVEHLDFRRREGTAPFLHRLARDLVRLQRGAVQLQPARPTCNLAQLLARVHAVRVVREAVTRLEERKRKLTLHPLVQKRLAVALQAQRRYALKGELRVAVRRHQHLGRLERAVERRDAPAVEASRGGVVGRALWRSARCWPGRARDNATTMRAVARSRRAGAPRAENAAIACLHPTTSAAFYPHQSVRQIERVCQTENRCTSRYSPHPPRLATGKRRRVRRRPNDRRA
mmetsp:Transcript_11054/g.34904  ORF Transcript_11054/g.34904 Transcript_11054/m.34904 type:complete len:568 (+) Transcript_11054:822-2525(+)